MANACPLVDPPTAMQAIQGTKHSDRASLIERGSRRPAIKAATPSRASSLRTRAKASRGTPAGGRGLGRLTLRRAAPRDLPIRPEKIIRRDLAAGRFDDPGQIPSVWESHAELEPGDLRLRNSGHLAEFSLGFPVRPSPIRELHHAAIDRNPTGFLCLSGISVNA